MKKKRRRSFRSFFDSALKTKSLSRVLKVIPNHVVIPRKNKVEEEESQIVEPDGTVEELDF